MGPPLHPKGKPVCGELERWARRASVGALIGLDEAGRGPLAGPVVAAAVALPHPCPIRGLDDSKRLDEARRETLFTRICERAVGYAIASCDHAEIDRINILQASLTAMARAWQELTERTPSLVDAVVLVDGKMTAKLPKTVSQYPAVKGDARSYNIAAASILAKVTRDRLMVEYDAQFPEYGFARHKGYPTAAHREALERHGPCAIHRRSFNLPAQMTLF